MLLEMLLEQWSREQSFTELANGVASNPDYRVTAAGLDSSSRVFLMAGLAAQGNRPALIITADTARAEKVYEDLLAFFPAHKVNLLPARELFISADILSHMNISG